MKLGYAFAFLFAGFQILFAQEASPIIISGGAHIVGESQMQFAQPSPKKYVHKKSNKKTLIATTVSKRTKKAIEKPAKKYTYKAVKFDIAKPGNTRNSQISADRYYSACASSGSAYQDYGITDSPSLNYIFNKHPINKPIEGQCHSKNFEYLDKKRNKSPPKISA